MTIPKFLKKLFFLGMIFLVNVPARAQHAGHHGAHDAPMKDELVLGTIDFPTSGSSEAHAAFLRGTLALYSFWYPEARDHFREARELDPAFAMAYWGEAMTYDHPLWIQLDTTAGRQVLAELDAVVATGNVRWTGREKGYIDALRIIYAEDPPEDHRHSYAEMMQNLAKQYPDDEDATVFAALARMTVPGFEFEEAADLVSVAAPLEEVYQQNPDHPGAVHYLIHLYDSPTYAPLGLRPARAYAQIAPASSHAIHMPSHIFRELGMWDEMLASNERAYQASVKWQERTNRPLQERDFHAYAWLLDASLKSGRYRLAQQLLDEFYEVENEAKTRGEPTVRLMVTRMGLELQNRHAADVAGMPAPVLTFPQELDLTALPPYSLPMIAEAAAILGDDDLFRDAAERSRNLLSSPAFVDYRNVVEGALIAYEAGMLQRSGHLNNAIETARRAMEMELQEKETDLGVGTVTLAELLLESGEAGEAVELFERLHARYPRNPRYTLGLARAASAVGDHERAAARYEELAEIWSSADRSLPSLQEAVRFGADVADR